MTRAFVLNSENQDVQIGGKLYHLKSGKIEHVQANHKGIFLQCEAYVEVPNNSLEFAKLAIKIAKYK